MKMLFQSLLLVCALGLVVTAQAKSKKVTSAKASKTSREPAQAKKLKTCHDLMESRMALCKEDSRLTKVELVYSYPENEYQTYKVTVACWWDRGGEYEETDRNTMSCDPNDPESLERLAKAKANSNLALFLYPKID